MRKISYKIKNGILYISNDKEEFDVVEIMKREPKYPINTWNTSKLVNMRSLFSFSQFNENINNWDVSNVKDMAFAFLYNTNFNQPLDKWKLNKDVILDRMFEHSAFNQKIDWDIRNLEMFEGSAYNQIIDDKFLSIPKYTLINANLNSSINYRFFKFALKNPNKYLEEAKSILTQVQYKLLLTKLFG